MKAIKSIIWIAFTLILALLYYAFIFSGVFVSENLPNTLLMLLLVGAFSLIHLGVLAFLCKRYFYKSVFTFKPFAWLKENGALYVAGGIVLGMILSLATAIYSVFTHIYVTYLLITGKSGRKFEKSSYKSPAPLPKNDPPKTNNNTNKTNNNTAAQKGSGRMPTAVTQSGKEIKRETKFTADGLAAKLKYGLNGSDYAEDRGCRYCKSTRMTGFRTFVYEDSAEIKVTFEGIIEYNVDRAAYSEAAYEIGVENKALLDDRINTDAQRLSEAANKNCYRDIMSIIDDYERSDGDTPKDISFDPKIFVRIVP